MGSLEWKRLGAPPLEAKRRLKSVVEADACHGSIPTFHAPLQNLY